MRKPNILVVVDKWLDGNPQQGHSTNYNNIVMSLEESEVCHPDFIFFDERQPIDIYILEALENKPYDGLIVVPLGLSHLNPTPNIIEYVQSQNIPICYHWIDTVFPWCRPEMLRVAKYSKIQLAYDIQDFLTEIPGMLIMWTPEAERLFYPEHELWHDISFFGTVKHTRSNYLNKLIQADINIKFGAGQRNTKMSLEDYGLHTRKSKMVVNFSTSEFGSHVKGRVFEAIQSGCLLLEEQNDKTSRFFEPGKDYVEFSDPDELLYKCEYYLKHDDERQQIAKNGYEKARRDYTNYIYWSKVLEKLCKK